MAKKLNGVTIIVLVLFHSFTAQCIGGFGRGGWGWGGGVKEEVFFF